MWQFAVLILSCLFFVNVDCYGKTIKSIKILKVEGNALIYHPWSAKWRKLRPGRKVWDGSLVQVGRNSSVTFDVMRTKKYSDIGQSRVVVTIKRPMVLRVDSEILRKIKLDPSYLSAFPLVTEDQEVDEEILEESLFDKIQEAWERNAAVYAGKDVQTRSYKDRRSQDPSAAEAAINVRKISLIYPKEKTVIALSELPSNVRIEWHQIPVKYSQYSIYVWEYGNRKPEPIGKTNANFFNANFTNEGRYFLQITAQKESWQSEVVNIHVGLMRVASMDKMTKRRAISKKTGL